MSRGRVVRCLWSVGQLVCGLWSVVCGLWSVVCGLWSVEDELKRCADAQAWLRLPSRRPWAPRLAASGLGQRIARLISSDAHRALSRPLTPMNAFFIFTLSHENSYRSRNPSGDYPAFSSDGRPRSASRSHHHPHRAELRLRIEPDLLR